MYSLIGWFVVFWYCIYYLWCFFCICVFGYCTMHGALWCLQGYRYHSVDFGDFMDTSA